MADYAPRLAREVARDRATDAVPAPASGPR
jgi:hypothetical protein